MAQDAFILTPFGNGSPRWFLGSAAPTSGTYDLGDLVINTAPSAGGTWAWVCTTAGSAGTWKAISIAS